MTDKSRWKNKNRNILLGVKEGVKKIAEPFIKEAVGLEEAKALLKGLRPKKKTRSKSKK